MARVATRRLIDASASLDAADRALLNLWINHGLPDPALARMTGMEPAAIADRRQGIVERLSEQLGLSPDEVSKALAEVAAASAALPPGEGGPLPEDPNLNGRAPAGAVVEPPPPPDAETEPPPPPDAETEPPPPPDAETEPPAAPEPEGESPPPATERAQKRVLWATCGAVLALLVAGILVIALGSSSGGPRRPTVRPTADTTTAAAAPASATQTTPTTPSAPATSTAPTTPTTPAAPATSTAPTGSTTATAPAPSPAVSAPPPLPLAALPGGVAKATGAVVLTRDGRKLKLKLTVRELPAAHRGHYEVWLYDSIIDAKPLGRLAARVQHLTITLPKGARHYRWIDISFQPAGFVNHSGVSVLRAGNPAHASARQLRKRVHRRRQLRRASGSSRASTSK